MKGTMICRYLGLACEWAGMRTSKTIATTVNTDTSPQRCPRSAVSALKGAGDVHFRLPNGPRPDPGFLRQPLDFTTAGRDVLAGRLDWLSLR